jgi:hypothetical protein
MPRAASKVDEKQPKSAGKPAYPSENAPHGRSLQAAPAGAKSCAGDRASRLDEVQPVEHCGRKHKHDTGQPPVGTRADHQLGE